MLVSNCSEEFLFIDFIYVRFTTLPIVFKSDNFAQSENSFLRVQCAVR